MLVYLVTNIQNHKVYVGKTSRPLLDRVKEHVEDSAKGSVLYFHRALRKYGSESFDWQVIDQVETERELNEKEKYWIQFYKSFDPQFGYNLTMGGDGVIPTEETRRKMSQNHADVSGENHPMYGKHHTAESREKMAVSRRGRKFTPHSEVTKRKISEANKGQVSWIKGRHHSKETKEKIAKWHKGKSRSSTGRWL